MLSSGMQVILFCTKLIFIYSLYKVSSQRHFTYRRLPLVSSTTSLILNNLPSDWIISFDENVSDTLVGDGLISDTLVARACAEK